MIGVLPCSGSCNVGQLTAKAVIAAMEQRPGEVGFVCALGLPLGIPGIVKKARENYDAHMGLDGCPVGCASKALRSAGVQPATSLVVDQTLCLEKTGDMRDETGLEDLIARVVEHVDALSRGGL